jgi:antitoxin FitA
MSSVTIRKIAPEVHRALKARAASAGRSTEAEIRLILEHAVKPPERVLLGDAMAAIGRKAKLTDAEVEAILACRDRSVGTPVKFE